MVIIVLLILWLTMASIQLIYILFVYSRTAFHRQPEYNESDSPTASDASSSGVSIVVFARNELDNLTELLPLLNAQQYPIFNAGDGRPVY